jgi:hypothetical protein
MILRMFSIRDPSSAILLLATLEVLCSTYFLYVPNFYGVNSILFLFAGIGICFCLLRIPPLKTCSTKIASRQLLVKLFLVMVILPVSYQLARGIMDRTPLQIEYADMLPIMKTMCRRFLDGQWKHVYDPIPEIWNGFQSIYLPAMWLPFSSALLFDFDLRWVTVCGIWLTAMICLLPQWKKDERPFVLIGALFVLLAWFHLDEQNNVIRLTEEGVIFFYYGILAVAIIAWNPWLLGISVALCLLSRYSLVGWIPFAALYMLLTKQLSFLIKAIASSLLVILVILILPFGINPLLFHLHFQNAYVLQAPRVWREHPEYFYHSLGFAKFFGPDRIRLLHLTLTTGTFLIPLVFLFWLRKKMATQPNVLLAGFQLSITFFYNFIDVSYLYLFYTPVFVSLVIAGWSLAEKPAAILASIHTAH